MIPRDKDSGLYKPSGFVEVTLLHCRFIHASDRIVRKSAAESKTSTKQHGDIKGSLQPCQPFKIGKATRRPFHSKFEYIDIPGEVIHSDLNGPVKTSVTVAKYLCSFVDQATRHLTVAWFSQKSEAETSHNLH